VKLIPSVERAIRRCEIEVSQVRDTQGHVRSDALFHPSANDIGRHTLRARATDAAGNTQPEVPPWNRLGYGNNAIEVVYIDVR